MTLSCNHRYALVSAQGKGQPKYVRMRGQTVEEVQTKTEYTSAVSESRSGPDPAYWVIGDGGGPSG
jgi:hypothetical protein